MESSSEAQRKFLQEDVTRTKGALFALEQEKLLTGMFLEGYKDDLSYSQNFLDGHYSFTFLIQGDPQTGKTTFLNVLLDDAIIPSSGHNAIIVVQYDETWAIPALFTAHLNEIFNSERQIFVINPGILRDTGIRGGADIHLTLKNASKTVTSLSGQTAFVIKYKIPWLKELIADDFILNRIQFVDIDMPPENDPNPENLLRLENITSSTDHANIFVADGTKLFTIDTAAKYKELSENKENKEKSLLVMNRIDQLGVKEHIKKIRKNESKLCSKLQLGSIKTIKDIIEESEDTEEMRCEIFLQSFYEDLRIDQNKLTDGDVIYFVSALFAFNQILLSMYEKCQDDQEKDAICALFDERNQDSKVYQNNKRNAAFEDLDIIQYYIKVEPDLYQSNFEPIKKAISNISKTKFAKSRNELIKRVEEIRLKISDCGSYLTEALSEQIEELKTSRAEIKKLIEERSEEFVTLVNNFKEKTIGLFETFFKGIDDINKDFYFVKANHAEELTDKTKQFEEEIKETIDKFGRDYMNMETRYKKKINDLNNANKDKQYMNYYITNNVRPEYEVLEKKNENLVKLIRELASYATNRIISFVDGRGFDVITNLLRFLAQIFGNANILDSFKETVEKSKSIFQDKTSNLMNSHCKKEKKKMDEFEDHFIKYLRSTKSGNIERAQKIIQEHFKSLKK